LGISHFSFHPKRTTKTNSKEFAVYFVDLVLRKGLIGKFTYDLRNWIKMYFCAGPVLFLTIWNINFRILQICKSTACCRCTTCYHSDLPHWRDTTAMFISEQTLLFPSSQSTVSFGSCQRGKVSTAYARFQASSEL